MELFIDSFSLYLNPIVDVKDTIFVLNLNIISLNF